MMKKRIVMLFLIVFLVGCSKAPEKQEPVKQDSEVKEPVEQSETSKAETAVVEESQVEEEKPVEPVEETSSMTQEAFAISMFAQYGKDVDATMWHWDEQGPNKVAVIIKEKQGRGRPNISRLVFLWHGDAESAEVLFMMVDNAVVLGSE